MTTRINEPTVLDPDATLPTDDPTRAWRRSLTTVLGAAAPLLLVISNVLLPSLHGKTAQIVAHIPPVANRLLAAHLIYAFASVLFIPFTLAIWRIDVRKGAGLRFVGGVLTIVGMVCNALGEVVDGYLAWGAHHVAVDPASQVKLFDLLDNSAAALPISFLAIPVGVLGAILLTVGVLRAKVVPVWAPWAMLVGALISAAAGVGVTALLGLVFAVGGAAVVLYIAYPQRARS